MAALKKRILPYLWITLASAAYALAFNWCYGPGQIAFGGITGVGQILNRFLPWLPVGGAVFLLNLPLFLLGWRLLGGHLLVSSLYAMGVSSLFIDLLHVLFRFQAMDPFLSCVFGGSIVGLSLGVVFLQGATTGGTDLIARLLKLKLAWLPMGRLLMLVDLLVIAAAALVFRSVYSALYGVVALSLSAFAMDRVLYGLDNAKVAYIISGEYRRISSAVTREMGRGVTILHGEGGWSQEEKRVLLVAFRQRQIVSLKRMVREIDPGAFLIVCDAHEILGNGFGRYQADGI